MKLFALWAASLAVFLSSCTQGRLSRPADGPDKVVLMHMLKSGQYKSLMKKLDDLAAVIRTDKTHEEYYWRAFDTFEIPDSSIQNDLDAWIRKYPACANAYAARAGLYLTVGWSIRGYGWGNKVPEEHWNGMEYYFKKAWADAITGLKLDSLNLQCYFVLMKISMNIGTPQLTRTIFEQAVAADSTSMGIWAAYMWSLQPRWGGSHEEMAQLAEASAKYVTLNPRLAALAGYIDFDEGRDFEENHEYSYAIAEFDSALSFGERADFYKLRGYCYYALDKYRKALADYDNALRLSPQDPEILCWKAYSMFYLEHLDQARELVEEAREISPTGQFVIPAFNFICGDSSEANFHCMKGYNLMLAKKYREAIVELNHAVKEDSGNYLSYYDRAYCYKDLGKSDEAIADFKRAIALKPGDADALHSLGGLLARAGKLNEAVSVYSAEIAADPNGPNGYSGRAYCYIELGMREKALKDLKAACELGFSRACEGYKKLSGE